MRLGIFIIFGVMVLPIITYIPAAFSQTMLSSDPLPRNSFEWFGYAFYIPAIASGLFYPYLRVIGVAVRQQKSKWLIFSLINLTLIVHFFTGQIWILWVGYVVGMLVERAAKQEAINT